MAARRPLTPRQRDVLVAIHAHFVEVGYAPTVRELCAAVGLSSTFTVQKHLDTLERKGYLRRPIHYGNRAIALCGFPTPAELSLTEIPEARVRLRIDVGDTPPTAGPACAAGHPRTGANAWHVAGVVLCRACGRAAVAADLAARAVG